MVKVLIECKFVPSALLQSCFASRLARVSVGEFSGAQVSLFRRMAGITIDWLACYAIAKGFHLKGSFAPLLIFFFEVTLLTTFGGASFGHRLVGLKVVRYSDAGPVTPVQSLIRTTLLLLIVTAITFDENGRGINERLSNTVLITSKKS